MGNKKNIDRLFQEKFKNFNETPNNNVWQNIENSLNKPEQNKKPFLPLWMKLGSIAATITLLIFVGFTQFTSFKITPTVVNKTAKDNNSTSNYNTNENTHVINRTNTTLSNSNISNTEKSITTDHMVANQSSEHIFEAPENTTSSNKKIQLATQNAATITNTTYSENSKNNRKSNHDKKTLHIPSPEIKTNIAAIQQNFINHPNKTSNIKQTTNIKNSLITQNTKNTYNSIDQNNINLDSDFINPKNSIVTENQDSSETTIKSLENQNSDNDPQNDLIKKQDSNTATVEATPVKENENKEVDKKSITEAIAEQKTQDDDEINASQESGPKWKIAPNIAPVYYNSLSKGSPIDNQFADNKKQGQINTSYGINASYKINNKLIIRTGIHKLELGYRTKDVAISSLNGNNTPIVLKGLEPAPGVNLNISSENSFAVSQISTGYTNLFDSALIQQLGYLEIPLEIGYQISDKKLKINMIAGLSTFILDKNEIYSETNDIQTYLGSGNNLNKTSFSTNVGIGFNYGLTKKLNFNVEPVFKYQVNSFNKDAGNFRPYILGVYTGLSFKF